MKPEECTTRKRRYRTQGYALEVLGRIQDQSITASRPYVPTAVLWCPKCRGYHLTSKSQKPRGRGKQRRGLVAVRRSR